MVVTEDAQYEAFKQSVMAHKGYWLFDVETNGLNAFGGKTAKNHIIGYAVSLGHFKRKPQHFYIPVRQQPHKIASVEWRPIPLERQPTKRKRLFPENMQRMPDGLVYERMVVGESRVIDLNRNPEEVGRFLEEWILCGSQPVVGHNIKFDRHMVRHSEGLMWTAPTRDTMLAAHYYDENERSYGLKQLGVWHTNSNAAKRKDGLKDYADLHDIKNFMGELEWFPLFLLGEYAEQDNQIADDLLKFYAPALRATQVCGGTKSLYDLWLESNEYNEVVAGMEEWGIRIDLELCEESIALAEQKVEGLQNRMTKLVGFEFNPGSNKQVEAIIYPTRPEPPAGQKWKQRPVHKLALMNHDHPLCPYLLEHRQWKKALTTYYRPWLEMADDSGRLHPNILLIGTIAGRPSCRNPNMMNLPRASSVYDVRRAIRASENRTLVSFDFSQIELRVCADCSEDPIMLELYRRNGDIHTATSHMIGLNKMLGEEEGRQAAKTLNFAMLYGMGASGLQLALYVNSRGKIKVRLGEAASILERFKSSYPTVANWCGDIVRNARRERYVELWSGRRRRYPMPRYRGEEDPSRKAVNNLIQGGAAEIMRYSLCRLSRMFASWRRENPCEEKPEMVLCIYDDILFDIPDAQVDYWLPRIKTVMEDWEFKVPILTEAKVGKTWAGMKKRDDFGTLSELAGV